MDAIEFIKEYNRMCEPTSCHLCPAFGLSNGCDLDTKEPERLITIVQQWSQSHPKKSMMQDFFEKFPNAPRTKDGTPVDICPNNCGYTNEPDSFTVCDRFDENCLKCWSRPLEE